MLLLKTANDTEATAPSPPDRRRASRRTLVVLLTVGAGVLSGILLRLAQPSIDIGPIAFVGLIPLVVVSRSTRRGIVAGTACGLTYYGLLLSWVWPFAWFGWLMLVAPMALTYTVFGAVAGYTSKTKRSLATRVLVLPAIIVAGEWLWSLVPFGGFSWGQLGTSQHDISLTLATVAVGGVGLLTWLVGAVNILLARLVAEFWRCRRGFRGARAMLTPALGLGLVVVIFGVGWLMRPNSEASGSIDIGVVQANIWEHKVSGDTLYNAHLDATRAFREPVDLVVWGESSLKGQHANPGFGIEVRLAAHGTPVLANAIFPVDETETGGLDLFPTLGGDVEKSEPGGPRENRNVLIDEHGNLAWHYAKRHLVPFGEYVPFRDRLGFVGEIERVTPGVRAGTELGLFDIEGHTLGSLICFESTFPRYVRDTVSAGAEALVVTTNNASFGYSSLASQNTAIQQIRAVETHRPVVVAAISGPTASIDAQGRLLDQTGLFEQASVAWEVPTYTDETLYMRFGDWANVLAVLVLIGGGMFAARRWLVDR